MDHDLLYIVMNNKTIREVILVYQPAMPGLSENFYENSSLNGLARTTSARNPPPLTPVILAHSEPCFKIFS